MLSNSVLMLVLLSGFAAAGLVVLVVVGRIYNQLVGLKNIAQNGFSQIEIQLKRRYDLIPNLVECVKSYMTHERETLHAVIAARNQASTQLAAVNHQVTNPQALQGLASAEAALGGALSKMSFVMESYPELKANEVVAQLTEELSSTENRIAFARQVYNDSVTTFNVNRQSFPTVLLASSFGFSDDLTLLEFENSAALQDAPKVALT